MMPSFVWYGQDRSPCHAGVQISGLPRDPRAGHCICRVLEGWAERVRAELQSQGQGTMEGSRMEDSMRKSWSSPAACCLHFGAHGKIHLPLKATLHPPAPQPSSGCMSWLVADGWAGSWPGAGRRAGSQGVLHPSLEQLAGGASPGCLHAAAGAEPQGEAGPYFLPPAPSLPIKAGQQPGPVLPRVPRYSHCPVAGTWLFAADRAAASHSPSEFLVYLAYATQLPGIQLSAGSWQHQPSQSHTYNEPCEVAKAGDSVSRSSGRTYCGQSVPRCLQSCGQGRSGGLTLHCPQVASCPLLHGHTGPAPVLDQNPTACRSPLPPVISR